jgi:hypothetical protein
MVVVADSEPALFPQNYSPMAAKGAIGTDTSQIIFSA